MFDDLCENTKSMKFAIFEENQVEFQKLNLKRTGRDEQYKCMKCTDRKINDCNVCNNKKSIDGNHPLAILLGEVMKKKTNLKQIQKSRVQIIKEEEEEIEDKKYECVYCKKQVVFSKYICLLCPSFAVCENCQQYCVTHEHELTENFATSRCKTVRFDDGKKYCFNCSEQISDCYQICKTCQSENKDYWICAVCSDKRNFYHQQDHVLEATLYKYKFQLMSQEYRAKQQTNCLNNDKKFEQNGIQNLSIRFNLPQYHKSNIRNKILNKVSLNNQIKQNFNQSRVNFQLSSSMFSSGELRFKNINRIIINPPALPKDQSDFQCKSPISIISKQNIFSDEDYYFQDFQCDVCNINPIKNIRYHCKTCPNFDLCQKCYLNKIHSHQFDKIDRKQIKASKISKIDSLRQTIKLSQFHQPQRFGSSITNYRQ